MKYISFFIIIFCFGITPSYASELAGKISTDPNAVTKGMEQAGVADKQNDGNGSTDFAKIIPGTAIIQMKKPIQKSTDDGTSPEEVLVLGIIHFPNNSLIRGDDKRIYVIDGQFKIQVKNMLELKKYSGQEIFKVTSLELENYLTRAHKSGSLIREVGGVKVYHLENGKAVYVKNIYVLDKYFRGQEIFNIDSAEMLKYF